MIKFWANKINELCKQGYSFRNACMMVENWRNYGN